MKKPICAIRPNWNRCPPQPGSSDRMLGAATPTHSSTNEGSPAFTLIELLVVVAIIAILASLLLPVLSRVKDKAQNTIDFNNTRQLMLAMNLYCGDNDDYMPHPTWGSDGTGPDGWAYGTKLMSKCAGVATSVTLNRQLSNQVEA